MALTGRFVLLLALGAVPVVLVGGSRATGLGASMGVALLWALGCCALAALDLLLAASPRELRLERELPARVRLRESVTARLRVTNTGGRMLRATLRDAWTPSAGASTSRQPLTVAAHGSVVLALRLTPWRRGERRVRAVTVRSRGPLGLAARQQTVECRGSIRVLPPFDSRKHLPSRLARLRELDGRTSVMVRGQGTEFDALRDYVRGDDVRSIDWRATARRGEQLLGSASASPRSRKVLSAPRLVVRTWQPERDRRVVIVLDSSRTSAARVNDEPRLDTGIEASLLLAALADRAGDRVSLLAYDRVVRARVAGQRGPALLAAAVDRLAPLEPQLIEMDWTGVPGQVRHLATQRALVVLLTSLESVGAAGGLLAVLPQLAARHTVLVASVSDPAASDAAARRSAPGDGYRAAAAEAALLDRANLSDAVRRLGAHVVTGTPEALPPAVADAYLALKAAGRL